MRDWTENNESPLMQSRTTPVRTRPKTTAQRGGAFAMASLFYKLFPFFLAALLLSPLLLIDKTESKYAAIPVTERRSNLRGLERVTTAYLNAHPEAFSKLIRIVSRADDALQEEEFPIQGAVIEWLDRSMAEEGFAPDMPVYFLLRQVYMQGWAGAYFTQIDSGEREYLFDLMGATIGGLYRCICAPPGFHQT